MTLSHNSWVLYLSKQYFNIKDSLETTLSHIFEYHINQQQNQMQKDKYQQLYHTFLKSYIDQKQILLQENKYQQLYYTFFESYNIWRQILQHGHISSFIAQFIFVAVRNKL